MPRLPQIQRRGAGAENFQRGDHRDEYAEKQRRDFDNGMKVEMVGVVDAFRGCKPGKECHRNHDAFLNSFRPTEIPAQNCSYYDSTEVNDNLGILEMHPPARLYVLCQGAWSFQVFLDEEVLLEHIENHEKCSNHENPLWKQPQGPMKRYTAKKS